MVAESSSRQSALITSATEEVQAAQDQVRQLVEEQKEIHQELVKTVIETVTKVEICYELVKL